MNFSVSKVSVEKAREGGQLCASVINLTENFVFKEDKQG